MTDIYVSRQRGIEGDAALQELLGSSLDRLGASADALGVEQQRVPEAADARVRLFEIGGGLVVLTFLLEPSPGDAAVVVFGVWPELEARERARSRVLQLNPVNVLPEVVAARSAEEAEERRAILQRIVQSHSRLPSMPYESITEVEYLAREAGDWSQLEAREFEEPELESAAESESESEEEVEAAKTAKILAALERAKAEAAAAGRPVDDDVEWYVSIVGDGEPQVMFVTEQQRLAAEAEAEASFEGITGRASPMALTERLGLPREVLDAAWNAPSQEALDAVVEGCENEWHRRLLVRLSERADIDELMAEFGIETVVPPVDREPTEEERQTWQAAYTAAMDRWDLGDFVDEPVAPWLTSRGVLGAPASDAELIASFEHPTARLQFERMR